MPIKPENRARYPADWQAIRQAAGERAQWRCQHPGCGARQYSVGMHAGGWRELVEPSATYAQARQAAAECSFGLFCEAPGVPRVIVIVLTCAHLNHTPEDVRDENLRMLCQRHHLAHDHLHHMANAQATRRARAGTAELF